MPALVNERELAWSGGRGVRLHQSQEDRFGRTSDAKGEARNPKPPADDQFRCAETVPSFVEPITAHSGKDGESGHADLPPVSVARKDDLRPVCGSLEEDVGVVGEKENR